MTGAQIEQRYSIREAAKLTSLSVTSLNRAIAAGSLHAHRLGDRRTVIRATDLQVFIEQNERPLSQARIVVGVAPTASPAKPKATKARPTTRRKAGAR